MVIFILLSVLIALAAMVAVAYPILRRPRSPEPVTTSAEETADELLAQRDAAFQALRELSFDHEVGKITDEDFVVFDANLKRTAADSLRAIDHWEATADGELDRMLEGAVAARAAALAAAGRACPSCGRPAGPDDRFCGNCGAALPPAPEAEKTPVQLACPNCSRPYEPGDRFCAGCGQALS